MKYRLASTESQSALGTCLSRNTLGLWLLFSLLIACSSKPIPKPTPPPLPQKNTLPPLPQPDQVERIDPDEDPSVLPKAANDS